MNFFEKVNDITMRIAKGMLAIFAINLILVLAIFTFNACQSENIDYQDTEQAKNDFLAALSKSNDAFNNIGIANSYLLDRPNSNLFVKSSADNNDDDPVMQENTQTVCFTFNPNVVDLDSIEEDTETLGEALELGGNLISIDGIDVNIDDGTDDGTEELEQYCFEIPIQPTQQSLEPSIQEAKNYLYSRGLNDSDINEIMDGDSREELLIPVVIGLQAYNESNSVSSNYLDYVPSVFGIQSANAQTENKAVNCFLEATGISAGVALVAAFTDQATNGALKKAAKKMFKKVGAKIAGGVFGLALVIGEFLWCYNR